MATIEDLKIQAKNIKEETTENNNSASRIGAWLQGVLDIIESIESSPGKTAYESAVEGGYTGTETEFNTMLATIKDLGGVPGKTAYQSAVEGGFTGTEAEFNALLANMGSGGGEDLYYNDIFDI